MSKYQSYEGTPQKIRKTFDKVTENLNTTKIKRIDTEFKSDFNYKAVNIIDIVSNYEVPNNFDQLSINLIGFPDWAVNMIYPYVSLSLQPGFRPELEKDSLFDEFSAGTLELNDISIIRNYISHWLTKENDLYKFNIRLDLNPRFVSSLSEFGFGTSALQVFADIKLYIVNERYYDRV